MSKENNTQTHQGSELFDNYLSIKKALTTKIKSVLDNKRIESLKGMVGKDENV